MTSDAIERSTERNCSIRARPLKVLFLALELENGVTNGMNLRMHNIARHFDSRQVQPFLLAVNSATLDVSSLLETYADAQSISLEAATRSKYRKAYDVLTFSRWWASFPFPALPDAVSYWVQQWDIDCVLDIAGNLIASLPPHSIAVPVACDLMDAPTLAVRRRLRQSKRLREFAQCGIELLRQHAYQRRSLSSAKFISVVAELDAAEIHASLPEMEVLIIPNGVDTEHYYPSPTPESAFDIVFEGNLWFPPNVDAARYLVNDILPIIRASRPNVRVALIGKNPSQAVLSLASDSVTVTGTVDDVRPWVRSGAVFACAMRTGAGIKNKVLQAWSMGMPIVCTPETIPGLAAVDDEHLLVRNTPEQFAAAVLTLLNDRELATRLGEAGRRHVIKSFSWASQSEKLGAALCRLTGSAAGSTAAHSNRAID